MIAAASASLALALQTTAGAPLPNTNWIGQQLCLGLWRASISDARREPWPASESHVEAGGLRATHTLAFADLGVIEIEEAVLDEQDCASENDDRIEAQAESDNVVTRQGCLGLGSDTALGPHKSLQVRMRYIASQSENLTALVRKVATAQACERSSHDPARLELGPLTLLPMPTRGF